MTIGFFILADHYIDGLAIDQGKYQFTGIGFIIRILADYFTLFQYFLYFDARNRSFQHSFKNMGRI
jgi:hypothetical protein